MSLGSFNVIRIESLTGRMALWTALIIAVTPSLAAVTSEQNTDRPGSDFASQALQSPDPESCRAACDNDAKCSAYTYVKPGVQGSLAQCYLKDSVPAARQNDCCVSGVKTATPALRSMTARTPAAVNPPVLAQAPVQMQDAAVAEGAARQWATQAFVLPAASGFGFVKPRYGQSISQQWLVRFSVVNPLIGELSVDFTCFNSAGQPVAAKFATVAEAQGGAFQSGPLVVKGRAAKLVNLSTPSGVETWCRAVSNKPFLFSASRASYERMANPDEDKVRITESPVESFVLMK